MKRQITIKKIVLTNRYKIPISMLALFLILSESFFVSFQDRYSVLLILLFLLGIIYFLFEGIKHIPKINKYEMVWLVCIIIVACNNCFLEYGEKVIQYVFLVWEFLFYVLNIQCIGKSLY